MIAKIAMYAASAKRFCLGNQVLSDDVGKLLLRLTVGVMMLPHGIHGLTGGIDGVKKFVIDAGLPEFISYGVYFGEFVAPLLILTGTCTRLGGGILLTNMLFTFYLVHSNELLKFNEYGAFTLELNYLYAGGALSMIFLGGGRWSLCPKIKGRVS